MQYGFNYCIEKGLHLSPRKKGKDTSFEVMVSTIYAYKKMLYLARSTSCLFTALCKYLIRGLQTDIQRYHL